LPVDRGGFMPRPGEGHVDYSASPPTAPKSHGEHVEADDRAGDFDAQVRPGGLCDRDASPVLQAGGSETVARRVALGAGIRELREEKGWGVRRLGTRAGLSYSFLSRLENGLVGNVRPGDLDAIAVALGTNTDDLCKVVFVEAKGPIVPVADERLR